jgi:hypothetical protein
VNGNIIPQQIRFVNGDDGTEIAASSLKIILPNNESFVIETISGREGAAVFYIPHESSDNPGVRIFSIEPGAANLFSVNNVWTPRLPESQES